MRFGSDPIRGSNPRASAPVNRQIPLGFLIPADCRFWAYIRVAQHHCDSGITVRRLGRPSAISAATRSTRNASAPAGVFIAIGESWDEDRACSSRRQGESDPASRKRSSQSGVDYVYQVVVPLGLAPHGDRPWADGQAATAHLQQRARPGAVRRADSRGDEGTRESTRRDTSGNRRSRNVSPWPASMVPLTRSATSLVRKPRPVRATVR